MRKYYQFKLFYPYRVSLYLGHLNQWGFVLGYWTSGNFKINDYKIALSGIIILKFR